MMGTSQTSPSGGKLSEYISVAAIAKTIPLDKVRSVLADSDKESERHRSLPAQLMAYYVIAMGMFMNCPYREVLRCLVEGLKHLWPQRFRIPGHSAISQARTRLGWEAMQLLHDEVVRPIALPDTQGAWYGPWRVVSIDGSTLDVPDEDKNVEHFGRPGSSRGDTAYPQMRFVSLVEVGTHVLFGSRLGPYSKSEHALTREILGSLDETMLCLGDRGFFCYPMWQEVRATGAQLVWRVKKNAILPRDEELSDGSYLSAVYPSAKDRKKKINGTVIRVIEYRLEGVSDAEPTYRVVTSILDPNVAPAHEMAALYHERWEIENTLDELKTHLRGSKVILRSKTPDLVQQEFYGLMMAHFVARGLMHEAARQGGLDSDRLSFSHAVRVIRRNIIRFGAFSPSRA